MLWVIAAANAQTASDWVNPHNVARQAVGAGLPDLTWDGTLATYATNWAQSQATNHNCALQHSGGPYGENIFWASWSSLPSDAVSAWVGEKQYYHYATNSCAAGQVCGHYTQVIILRPLSMSDLLDQSLCCSLACFQMSTNAASKPVLQLSLTACM